MSQATTCNCHRVNKLTFWQTKTLAEMTPTEWELLCDGCAQCCRVKLEDEDTGELHHTSMVCDYLDLDTCRCTDYKQRHTNVPDCVALTPELALTFSWLPRSCAYRTLAEGRPLAAWHPLISGSPDTVKQSGVSVHEQVIHMGQIHPDDHEMMTVRWVDAEGD